MIFAAFPIHETRGAILAHSVTAGSTVFKKGHHLTSEDIRTLDVAGIRTVYAAKLEADDVHEDEAAEKLARALAGAHTVSAKPFTGRCNIHAAANGLARINVEQINAINAIDEGITIATLPPYEPADDKQMLATVKIIPFAVKRAKLEQALALAINPGIELSPYKVRHADLILTTLPGTKPSLLKKAERVIAARIAHFGIKLSDVQTCEHSEHAVAHALQQTTKESELTFILGASAIVDRADIVPSAIELTGGTLHHFGMPVDPGNLLLTAEFNNRPVLGLPGCARSPKLNGADWVIARLATGAPVRPQDIQNMGVGGLLKEIPSRPQPRNKKPPTDKAMTKKDRRIAALILAAGRSTRMGDANKLTQEVGLKPMISHVTDATLSAHVDEIILITGHQQDQIIHALGGRPLTHVHNPDYADGLSTSIQTGIREALACTPPVDAALILLGDMPFITADMINRLVDAYSPTDDRMIVVPKVNGKRGNPVLWDASFFSELQALTGDVGAKHLIAEHENLVAEVEFDNDAPLTDIDTQAALAALKPDR